MHEQHEIDQHLKEATNLYGAGFRVMTPSPLEWMRAATAVGTIPFIAVAAFAALARLPRPLETASVVGVCVVTAIAILGTVARSIVLAVTNGVNAQTLIKSGEDPPQPRVVSSRAKASGGVARSNRRPKRDGGHPSISGALRHDPRGKR